MVRGEAIHCPSCGAPLARYDQRDKWRCRQCAGVLVGAMELEVELGELGPAFVTEAVTHRPAGLRTRPCARCGLAMQLINLGPLELDRCDRDRLLWFDRGELGAVRKDLLDCREPWVHRVLQALDHLDEEEDLEDEEAECGAHAAECDHDEEP